MNQRLVLEFLKESLLITGSSKDDLESSVISDQEGEPRDCG